MNTRYDVAVIGTGPSGLTIANILGKLGIKTLVLEKNPTLSQHPKALNIDDEFFRLLHALGVGDAVRAHTKHPISFDYVSPLGLRMAFVQGRETEHNFPNRAAIFQPEFEPILMRAAEATGNVTAVFDQTLDSFTQNDEGVTLHCVNAKNEKNTYEVSYLVGADGAHSVCRKQLGIAWDQVDPFDVRHVVIDVENDIDPSPLALTKMGWRRNFFSMPAANGRRFEFSLRPNETAEQLLDDDLLRKLFKPWRDYDSMKVIRKVVHTFRACIAKSFHHKRVFLIGDAAHLMPVFGSQGMNSGARDANNLGWKIASAVKYGSGTKLLNTYESERWSAVLATIKMAIMNGNLQKVQSIPKAILRDLFFGALRFIPPAQRYIREMKYIPKPFLRSDAIYAANESGAEQQLVGRIYPNPSVQSQGKDVLLDDLIGMGFALIGVNVDVDSVKQLKAQFAGLEIKLVLVNQAPDAALSQALSGDAQIVLSTVVDTRFDGVFAKYAGQWLLTRPDRVVAAAGDAKLISQAVAALLPIMCNK
jgi:3-(3-hydroxy-phenyl)propionate hydroxylase